MKKEFKFTLNNSKDLTVFRAIELDETGVYRVEWDEEDGYVDFQLYLPEYVEVHMNKGDWVLVD